MIRINNLDRPAGGAVEAFVGETLTITPTPTSVRLPNGETIGLEGSTYAPTAIGWHTFATAAGSLRVLVFSANALDAVPTFTTGRASGRTVAERRLVLRALASDPNPNLSGGELADVRACGDLRAFGA